MSTPEYKDWVIDNNTVQPKLYTSQDVLEYYFNGDINGLEVVTGHYLPSSTEEQNVFFTVLKYKGMYQPLRLLSCSKSGVCNNKKSSQTIKEFIEMNGFTEQEYQSLNLTSFITDGAFK